MQAETLFWQRMSYQSEAVLYLEKKSNINAKIMKSIGETNGFIFQKKSKKSWKRPLLKGMI